MSVLLVVFTSLLGIFFGFLTFLITALILKPIEHFLKTRHSIISDFVFYENVINAEGLNEEMQKRHLDRQEKIRRYGSELRATYYNIPFWARWIISKGLLFGKKMNPVDASKNLIGLSNTIEYELANKIKKSIMRSLAIDEECDK